MKIKIALGISVAAVCQVTVASAQESDRSRSGLEEIVVTAQKRAESLQDTPLAITAVDSELMEARSQTDISQVAAQALKLGAIYGPAIDTNFAADWYSRVVVAHARKALRTDNPAQYVRGLHKACLLENT